MLFLIAMIKSLFWFVAFATLAAGYVDEYYHGCRETLTLDASRKGRLSSPLYGERSEYPPNLSCFYKIVAPLGHKIKLTFKDLDVVPSAGCREDKLSIYGKDLGDVLVTFCGTELPRAVLSKENELNLEFHTDFMQGGRGFLLEYESGPDMQLCDSGLEVCRNRNCYDPKKECDGVDDCGDGTDEENCGHPLVVTPAECGTPEIPPRIGQGVDRMVGGEEVIPNSWPWQVSLQATWVESSYHFCGGTLINAMWVLAAAHCAVVFSPPGQMKVVLGSHGKFSTTPYQQVRYSNAVFSYPELTGDELTNYTLLHDITLIKLNAPVQFNAGVQPACLPDWGSNPKPGLKCYATGWGQTRGSGSSHALKQTFQIVKTQEECLEDFNHPAIPVISDKSSQVCVGNPGQFPCSGDSGGPLNCKVNDKWYVMGAVSYPTLSDLHTRALCGGKGYKTIYAATATKYDWIKNITVEPRSFEHA